MISDKKIFKSFPVCKSSDSWGVININHRAIIWTILVERMPHTNYLNSRQYGFWQDFFIFFLLVAMTTRVLQRMEFFERNTLQTFINICLEVQEMSYKATIAINADKWTSGIIAHHELPSDEFKKVMSKIHQSKS